MDLTPLIFGSVSTVPKEARGAGLVTVSQSLWDWPALVQNSALPSFSPVTCASFPPVVQQMVSVRPEADVMSQWGSACDRLCAASGTQVAVGTVIPAVTDFIKSRDTDVSEVDTWKEIVL